MLDGLQLAWSADALSRLIINSGYPWRPSCAALGSIRIVAKAIVSLWQPLGDESSRERRRQGVGG